ncbi:MAG: hypothetical protein WBG35_14915, partial [Acidobacteriaceae bacterium]
CERKTSKIARRTSRIKGMPIDAKDGAPLFMVGSTFDYPTQAKRGLEWGTLIYLWASGGAAEGQGWERW